MSLRAFPVVFATSVTATAEFYENLGFRRHFQLPAEGEPGYVALRRDDAELAVVDKGWPADQYGRRVGADVRFEMFVYVDDLDAAVRGLAILRPPADMPWGERIAYVTDPDGNPVALAQAVAG